MSTIEETLQRLEALHPRKIDLSLDRIARLSARLGSPHRHLPPVVHVAGTNGKGSTIAFLRAMLEAAGLAVHVYTSPHLVRFAERFRLGRPGGGVLVDDDELAAVLAEVEALNAGEPITLFEIITAAGFVLFKRHAADVLLLEVGMGGRLDATNLIEHPAVTVITPIALDHTDYLGTTIEAIAQEKAGILKRGAPAVLARQDEAVRDVIARAAARLAAPLSISGEDWHAYEEGGRLVFQDDAGLLDLPRPRLAGRHQIENAGAAIAALRALKSMPVPSTAIETGIVSAEWPARLQRLGAGKLSRLLPPGSELWLDGAHNPAGAAVLAAALADLEERAGKPVVLVCGMLDTKDAGGFLKPFAGLARRLLAVPVAHERARPPEALAELARSFGLAAETAPDVEAALRRIAEAEGPPPRVLIAGSLYLAGEVLARDEMTPA